jgi:hypothetical protein
MEALTITLPKVQSKSLSISISKKLLEKAAETATVLFLFAGALIWLFVI